MDKLVSVIVPVYNVDRYLGRCIKSIMQQSYRNLEIILVDDGSTDNSGTICDTFKETDDRIIVIHKEMGDCLMPETQELKCSRVNMLHLLIRMIMCRLI